MQNKMWFSLAILRQCLLVNEFARDGEIRRERPLQHLEQLTLQWMVQAQRRTRQQQQHEPLAPPRVS